VTRSCNRREELLLDAPTMGLLDAALDASVVLSFGTQGFRRHARRFDAAPLPRLDGKTVVVTGANSGLGLAATRQLAALGAHVVMACRDLDRARSAQAQVSGATELEQLDLASAESVERFCRAWGERPLHALVNNAGLMAATREQTPEGLEVSFAINALGTARLTLGLMPALRRSRARVVLVSSGGMYLAKLDLEVLQGRVRKFDGVTAYAQAKRAQVILTELLAAREPAVTFSAMHPGWADTRGVQTSLPTFRTLTQPLLRSADEGADTVTWLVAAEPAPGPSGAFWFDRAPAKTHAFPWTRESEADRQALARLLLVPPQRGEGTVRT